ncbi:MAG TPA: FkbM family methyltransferase [Longimicrobium sp.]|nr:FkbM family methyltransferase [Longimicrobium sp.]
MAWAVRRLPAGRYRAMNLAPRDGGAFWAELPRREGGLRFVCDLRDVTAREVFFTGRYAPQEMALLDALLRPGGTLVDVGANWGWFTLLGAARVGAAGRVVALEPDPRLFAQLEANLAANALAQVDALPLAAAGRDATLTLEGYDPHAGNWGVSSLVAGQGGGHRFEVAGRRVDGVLDEQGIGTVDLLKMDIEGAEDQALRGMEAGLAGGRYRRLLVELHPGLHPRGGALLDDVAALLRKAGYRGWAVDSAASTTRRASYSRRVDAASLLRALDGSRDDPWPHQLWAAPGEEPL